MKSDSQTCINQQDGANGLPATQAPVLFQTGLALHHKGQLAQAQAIYQQVLKLQPGHFDTLYMLGMLEGQAGNSARAVEWIDKALQINPNYASAYSNRGNALNDLKQHQAAIVSYDLALALKPDHVNAHYNRGRALYELKHYQAAIDGYDKAIAIRPNHVDAHYNRGLALYELKRYQAAIDSYDQAISSRPDSADAYYSRGLALHELKRYQAAIESYDKAIGLRPDYAEAYCNRGIALTHLKQYQAAIDSFDNAIAVKPDLKFIYGLRLHTKMQICDWHDAIEQIADLTQRIQRNEEATRPFEVLALSTSLELQRKAAELYVNEKNPANLELGHIPKRPQGQKIRLAYFSMDFRNHPVARLTAGLFETHDRDRFEVYAFSFGMDTKDEMRSRLERAFDKFIDVKDKSDKEIAELGRLMEIDIAIDLAGFTTDSRTGIFALRAAPLQVNYLGYPGTMGADYMDYLIADRTLVPQESSHHYSEKIVHLPDTYMVNDSQRTIADKVFSREELGLPESGFVFCCFNNSYKITPGTFDGWMRILKRVEGSVLWLSESNPSATENLRKVAVQRGVDPERLVFARKVPLLADHLARHRAADLFIDTLPYNAHTTASDALWAGLPVLTCTGEAFASRVAASLLTAIDLPELITSTQEDYEALAVELATEPERLKAIRQKLERNRLTTPLFDTRLFTKHIEQAYTQMFERYQADLPPEHIYVSQSEQTEPSVFQ